MREVGAFEAKNTLGALLDYVQQGEEVIITRHGKRVARLVPERGTGDRTRARAAAARIRHRAALVCEEPIDTDTWHQFRDNGRR